MVDDQMTSLLTMVVASCDQPPLSQEETSDLGHTDASDTTCLLSDDTVV